MTEPPLFISVVLSAPRKGRQNENVARFVVKQVSKQANVETKLIDACTIAIAMDDEGESLKNSQFSVQMQRANGLIIVVPNYNLSYLGLLKHVLDTCLKEYIHKAVGLCSASAGLLSSCNWRVHSLVLQYPV